MSEYSELLHQLRTSTETIAKNIIPKLYAALKTEKKNPAEARIIIEHDIGDLYSKRTILANLPDEAKDEKQREAGKKGAETKQDAAADRAAIIAATTEPMRISTDGSIIDEPSNVKESVERVAEQGRDIAQEIAKQIPSPQRTRYPFSLEKYYGVLNQNWRQGRKIIYIVIENGAFVGFEYK